MSSHREAPEISKDPVADNADVYAFVSPDKPDTVTIISNFVPLQAPPGGPNFFEFGDDVLYSIYIDNDGDAEPDIEYQFRFQTELRNPNTFLYNTGPIDVARQHRTGTSASSTPSPASTQRQAKSKVIGKRLACPPCNIGPRSTPKYDDARSRRGPHPRRAARPCSAGQRNDGFFVDLGGIFDLGDLRPFQNLHLIPTAAAPGVDDTKTLNIHAIAIQVPIKSLTRDGSVPNDVDERDLGARHLERGQPAQGADGRRGERREGRVGAVGAGLAARQPAVQRGDRPARQEGQPGTGSSRRATRRTSPNVEHPELAGLLPVLYPKVFPNLAGAEGGPGRPGRDPADRPARRRRPRLPELHGQDARPTCCG